MKVILISGKAENGKSETAKITRSLLPDNSTIKMAYGDYVKDTAKLLWGWNGEKDEEGRSLLQWWGTNFVREKQPDFWVETVVRLAEIVKDVFDYLLIDDIRFPNEIDIWKQRGFETVTVRIERPGHQNVLTEEQRQHPTEIMLDNWSFDLVLSASTKQELNDEINNKLIPYIRKDNSYGTYI